ncbi:hypothetical protein OG264_37230 [Streptomyces xanthophaeus]|uniref:hypothetical protein n=1 Tax=Streptomyces xanthophaeus TaxID=67385 RepID=UPI00386871AA|nr:hypothetical protein OG264_37230 [Streptomyces xanthophaeus]WST58353.1 hypothetical protein OG605_01205 [Streptomyces xanthophaeus]
MRRSVPTALAVLLALAATAGCGGQATKADAGPRTPAAGPATSSPAAPVKAPPLTEEQARGVVKDLAGKVEADNFDAAKKETVLRWSLFHQQRTDAPWHATFVARAPETTALPQIATGPDGRAVTGGDTAGLAADPATVCGSYGDYLHTDIGAGGVKWSKDVTEVREAYAGGLEAERKSLRNPAKLEAGAEVTRTPHGPVWRTTDGGALVACTAVSKLYTELGGGRATTFSSSGWAGTTGIPWASYTQRLMALTVLKVPAGGSGEVSVAAESNLPYSFEGTRMTG